MKSARAGTIHGATSSWPTPRKQRRGRLGDRRQPLDLRAPECRPVIQELFPKVESATITGAGHQVHADGLDEFLARLDAFLG
jgi:hypothetical protein